MLKQLTDLSIDVDGRYATREELQFLKNYLQSVEQRISAYEKIRDAETEIIDQLDEKIQATNPHLFMRGSKDLRPVCKRDRIYTLRCSAAAMLMDDLERLRDSFLLWERTIIQAFKDEQPTQITWQMMPEICERTSTKLFEINKL